jgi:hypothetical protein
MDNHDIFRCRHWIGVSHGATHAGESGEGIMRR